MMHEFFWDVQALYCEAVVPLAPWKMKGRGFFPSPGSSPQHASPEKWDFPRHFAQLPESRSCHEPSSQKAENSPFSPSNVAQPCLWHSTPKTQLPSGQQEPSSSLQKG